MPDPEVGIDRINAQRRLLHQSRERLGAAPELLPALTQRLFGLNAVDRDRHQIGHGLHGVDFPIREAAAGSRPE
jgi:hypothetical protein